MVVFFILTTLIILFSFFYLLKFSKNKNIFLFFFSSTFLVSFTIYNFTGNKNSFSYNNELEKQIKELIKDPNQFENIEPKEIIFLENKLKKKPNDLDGWILLARTCYISGYFQKAELYYNRALKYFPKNEIILYELAMLRKNTNKLISALSILETIYEINPRNLNSIELKLEILKVMKNKKLLNVSNRKIKKRKIFK